MLHKIKLALFALPLLAASLVAPAFAATVSMVNVPFDFSVGTIHMPAGQYTIESETRPAMVVLTNIKTGRQVQLLRPNGTGWNPPTLVFKRGPNSNVLIAVR